MRAEALKGHLDALLLAVLETGPLHGYAVIEALRAGSGGTFDLPTGTIYPALRQLERAGFVRSHWHVVAGRRRRDYELTSRRQALTSKRAVSAQFSAQDFGFRRGHAMAICSLLKKLSAHVQTFGGDVAIDPTQEAAPRPATADRLWSPTASKSATRPRSTASCKPGFARPTTQPGTDDDQTAPRGEPPRRDRVVTPLSLPLTGQLAARRQVPPLANRDPNVPPAAGGAWLVDQASLGRSSSRGARVGGWTLGCAAAVALAGVTGCTSVGVTGGSTAAVTGTPGPAPSWSVIHLPTGVEPRTLTAVGDRLLVAGLAAGTPPSPRMLTLDPAGQVIRVPLTPHSGYAFETRWQSVASDGTHVIAIGAASGGAHFNNRWTTWSGTLAGIEELPQTSDTFGGWGAGDLVDAVVTTAGDALVGTWGGAKAGLDGAVWLPSGRVWTRQDSAGTALESTRSLLVGPRSATPDGAGILVAGSALNLAPGSVTRHAALWRSTAPNSGWRRLDLPQPGRSSQAVSARCNRDHCLIAGQVDGSLAMWDLNGDTATRLAGLPAVNVRDSGPLPEPLVIGRSLVQLAAAQGHLVTLTRDGSTWSVSGGPDGTPTRVALVGQQLYVILSHGSGAPATLWQTDTQTWH